MEGKRMKPYRRKLGVVGAALGLAGSLLAMGPVDAAPKPSNVYNLLDLTIDDTHEVLTFDQAVSTASQTVGIRATRPGNQQSQGCGLGGPTKKLVLDVSSSDTAIATVSTPLTLEQCGDTSFVTVTPVGALGTAVISFALNAATNAPDPHTFTLTTATFDVTVVSGNGPVTPTIYWRHAPAIANQHLKGTWLTCVSWNTSKGKQPSNAHGNLISYLTHSVDAWLLVWAQSMSEFYDAATPPNFLYDRSNPDHVQAVLEAAYTAAGYPDWEADVQAFTNDLCPSGPTGAGKQFTGSSGAPPLPV
jgi:hypothetical protein